MKVKKTARILQNLRWRIQGMVILIGEQPNVRVERAAQRTVRCMPLLADRRMVFGGSLCDLRRQKMVD